MIELLKMADAEVPRPASGYGVAFLDEAGAWRVRLADGSFVGMMVGGKGDAGDKGDKGDKGDPGEAGVGAGGAVSLWDWPKYLPGLGAAPNVGSTNDYTIGMKLAACRDMVVSAVRVHWPVIWASSQVTARVYRFDVTNGSLGVMRSGAVTMSPGETMDVQMDGPLSVPAGGVVLLAVYGGGNGYPLVQSFDVRIPQYPMFIGEWVQWERPPHCAGDGVPNVMSGVGYHACIWPVAA